MSIIFQELRLMSNLAWRVDFNVALPSFEPLVSGSRNLLDLALSSPLPGGPRCLFVSSISSMRSACLALCIHPHDVTDICSDHTGSEPAVETIETGPEMAYGGGYPESKWVTEQLFRCAAEQTGLRTTAVRVGQVSGDQQTGGWNTTEWVAAIARASQRLGCMPSKDEVSSNYRSCIPLSFSLSLSILDSNRAFVLNRRSRGSPSTSLQLLCKRWSIATSAHCT